MPYGMKQHVDKFIQEMEAQKHLIPFTSPDGKEVHDIWINGQVRILPFGVMEYVFPKQDLDSVLNTLTNDTSPVPYDLDKIKIPLIKKKPLDIVRKLLKAKPIPKFKKHNKYLWIREHVSIIPIGIREERTRPVVERLGEFEGWSHEAI